jgi:uncharacterized integral membrane protein
MKNTSRSSRPASNSATGSTTTLERADPKTGGVAAQVIPLRSFHWLVTGPVTLVLIIFAASNPQSVSVAFWPLPFSVEAPLWAVALFAALLGFLAGEFVAWFGGRSWRRDSRHKARRIAALERELATTQAQPPREGAAPSLPASGTPRL